MTSKTLNRWPYPRAGGHLRQPGRWRGAAGDPAGTATALGALLTDYVRDSSHDPNTLAFRKGKQEACLSTTPHRVPTRPHRAAFIRGSLRS
jgi:hypothetical protein